jgi:hypothetical protein
VAIGHDTSPVAARYHVFPYSVRASRARLVPRRMENSPSGRARRRAGAQSLSDHLRYGVFRERRVNRPAAEGQHAKMETVQVPGMLPRTPGHRLPSHLATQPCSPELRPPNYCPLTGELMEAAAEGYTA